MESGIYIIRNIINNKVYIGKSVLIKSRIYNHKSALRGSRHRNKYLQRAYDKYGMDNFIFEVLEKCPEEQLSIQEGIWINIFQSNLPKYGYNIEYISEEGISNREYDRRTVEKEPKYLLINLETGEHIFYKQVATIYKDMEIKLNNKLTDLVSNQKKFYKGEIIRKKSYKNLLLINTDYYYDLEYIKYICEIHNKNIQPKIEKIKSLKEKLPKKEYIKRGPFKGYPVETYDLETKQIIEQFNNKYDVADKYFTSSKYVYKVLSGEKKSFRGMGLRYSVKNVTL